MQNFVYLVTLNGKKFLHGGDVQYTAANFEPFNLSCRGIDVAFLPIFDMSISINTRNLINAQIAPANVMALHFFNVSNERPQVQQLFPNATLFTQAPTTIKF